MRKHLILAFALVSAATMTSCGLSPMYGGASGGAVLTALGQVAVAPIPGKAGYLLQGDLAQRLGNAGSTPTRRLEIELDDDITGRGIRTDQAVTRERRTLRARYRLIDAVSGSVLLDATAGAETGIDVVSSEYATIAAEDTVLRRLSTDLSDQIVARLALYARRTAEAPAAR